MLAKMIRQLILGTIHKQVEKSYVSSLEEHEHLNTRTHL